MSHVTTGRETARFALRARGAGVLLHPTSLPGAYACGDLGPAAYAFVDFLARAGQRWWQMLPVGPIGPGNSPYSSSSAFAGSPLLISPERLFQDGLLSRDQLPARAAPRARVRFGVAATQAERVLRTAFERFRGSRRRRPGWEPFAERSDEWLEGYVEFAALRRAMGGKPWCEWPSEIRDRRPAALRAARAALAEEMAFERFTQYLFDRQWRQMRRYCTRRGIGLIGDIPIFVSHDSADVWLHRALFQLDPRGRARRVSGCPPDSFSRTGQLWGHPQYDWSAHRRSRFRWWMARFQRAFDQFDAVRIDHFLGFHRCWSIAAGAKTAIRGRWVLTPGYALFDALLGELGRAEIIAEDLGAVTVEAGRLRDHYGFPGMRILQNAFGAGARFDQPHNYVRNCVAYTGTHDNQTVVGWFRSLSRRGARGGGNDGRATRARALRYLACGASDIHWGMIRALYASVANTVVVPAQDILGLGDEARMNVPATPTGNWEWRLLPGALTEKHAGRLREMAETYER